MIDDDLYIHEGSIGNSNNPPGSTPRIANYSGAIAVANTPQNLTVANPNCNRIDIQNLDYSGVLLIGIGEDAIEGRSYEIDPRGMGVIESPEAMQRISLKSNKAGLKFVAIATVS